jgi:predicted polyphosphate/ATP-dependent NAD kinase
MAGLIGLLVNPAAGMGGRVGLHGTDGPVRLAEARRRGAVQVSGPRTVRALGRLGHHPGIEIVAAPGPMGMDAVAASGLRARARALDLAQTRDTTAADTEAAARLLAEAGVELLLFAGGDGTARDILRAVGQRLPLLGIPSGVKMRSGVFAASPEAAGDLAVSFLARPDRPRATAEVLDVAEGPDAVLSTAPVTEFHGIAAVPRLGDSRLTGAKVSTTVGSASALDALCDAEAAELAPDTLYLFGPGSTTGRILERLGIRGTALGVDAVVNGTLAGADLSEDEILRLMDRTPAARLVLGVIGGQGFLLGRGNQQIGPRVVARLRPGDLRVVAAAEKLTSLNPPALWVDSDEAVTRWLGGYLRVRIAPARYLMMRVQSS